MLMGETAVRFGRVMMGRHTIPQNQSCSVLDPKAIALRGNGPSPNLHWADGLRQPTKLDNDTFCYTEQGLMMTIATFGSVFYAPSATTSVILGFSLGSLQL